MIIVAMVDFFKLWYLFFLIFFEKIATVAILDWGSHFHVARGTFCTSSEAEEFRREGSNRALAQHG